MRFPRTPKSEFGCVRVRRNKIWRKNLLDSAPLQNSLLKPPGSFQANFESSQKMLKGASFLLKMCVYYFQLFLSTLELIGATDCENLKSWSKSRFHNYSYRHVSWRFSETSKVQFLIYDNDLIQFAFWDSAVIPICNGAILNDLIKLTPEECNPALFEALAGLNDVNVLTESDCTCILSVSTVEFEDATGVSPATCGIVAGKSFLADHEACLSSYPSLSNLCIRLTLQILQALTQQPFKT